MGMQMYTLPAYQVPPPVYKYKVTILGKNYKNILYNESLCYSIRFQEAETSWGLCILNVLISFIVGLLNLIQRQ